MHYLTLGHSPDLSLLELKSRSIKTETLSARLVFTDNSEILSLAPELAGITRVIEQVKPTSQDSLLADLTALVRDSKVKNHAITNYSNLTVTQNDLYQLRTTVKETRPVRFLSFDTTGHSLIAIRKQHVAEFSIINHNSQLVIGRTVWIQDADEWSNRDRSRPYQDITRGMLPPKIARVLVNLATQGKKSLPADRNGLPADRNGLPADRNGLPADRQGKLLDPFCGTGTILMEASLLGYEVVGSDNDQKAIEGSKANLEWLTSSDHMLSTKYQVLLSDATHIDEHLESIDYIATEPYLGPLLSHKNLPPHQKLLNIARGLDKLYRGALRSWLKILAPGGRVVIVIPEFHAYNTIIPTLKIDTIASLGYNYVDSVTYSKPGAIVVRNITILEKNK